MSNSGFKGVRVGINSVAISGSAISYEIAFINPEDGATHGLMRHSIQLEADSSIKEKADSLITALIERAAAIHFTNSMKSADTPADLTLKRTSYGIAEALGITSDETDEPDGAQG